MMRVTLNLSKLFSDHRSLAALLITSKMKIIKDVENRISEIFGINDFYLMCDDLFLPPLESTELISPYDTIWAVPISGSMTEIGEINGDNTYDVPTKKKSKKKKSERRDSSTHTLSHSHSADTVANNEYIEESEVSNSRKNKKKAVTSTPNGEASEDTPKIKKYKTEEVVTSVKKSKRKSSPSSPIKRKKKDEIESKSNEELEDTLVNSSMYKDSGIETSGEDKALPQDALNKNNVKTLVTIFENGRFKEVERKNINIIKTIIISNGSICSNGPSETCEDKSVKVEQASSTTTSDEEPDESIASGDTKIKRKRKRTRRRRETKSNQINEESRPVTKLVPRPILISKPAQHIKFDSSPETENIKNDLENTEPASEEQPKPEEIIQEKLVPEVVNAGITEEFILKQPLTPNLKPRLNDLIAFKILKISEDYTPEPSSYIVGKVINIDALCKEIVFRLIYGIDQCKEPTGKFSLTQEDDDDQTDEKITSVEQTFFWADVFETRLLFP